MWMIFLAGVGALIASQTILATLAVLAVAAMAFSTSHADESRKPESPAKEDLVASN